jgi:hypothetical protein
MLVAALTCVAFGGAGCATPGALHVYSLPSAAYETVRDTGPEGTVDVPSFIASGETAAGFAYDPFADHIFLRLAPGNRIRVIDRPARAIKREFKLAELPATGGGDLAIRPRDGHVFAIVPGEMVLVEFTRYGEVVGKIPLEKVADPPRGVAFDAAQNRLLILQGGSSEQISVHAPDGRQLSSIALDRVIAGDCLAFDSEKREFYAPLAGGESVGVFGEDGKFRRELPLHATLLDVGPRSFLRMF